MIDPHVHCRDGKQSYKETIAHAFEIAEKQGVSKIFDMPNTEPPIVNEKDVKERLKLVPNGRKNDYFLYIGATADKEQIKEAVECHRKFREIVGIKLYAGKSVGNLSVCDIEGQRNIYEALSGLGYSGVLAVHCEKESCMNKDLWDPSFPVSHSYARPKEAEIESINDQIGMAEESDFKGILHICHISCPESVELVDDARSRIKITCAATPHHVMWDRDMLERKDGLLYKTNPPLRDIDDVAGLRKYLKEGKIDWIETDHAPHPIGEKMFPPYNSGYPSLYIYSYFVSSFLPAIGIGKELAKKLTYKNIYSVFESKLR